MTLPKFPLISIFLYIPNQEFILKTNSKLKKISIKLVQQTKMMLQKVNDYTIIKILSQGQYHTVYLVQSPTKQKNILKLIEMNKDNINDATEKAQSYLNLKHPNIVNAIEYFYYKQKQYLAFVLEYCPAGDLSCLIGKINQDDAQHIILQLAQGLNYLHVNRVLHGDLRPENILIHNGAKISELGISKLMGNDKESTVIGTPFYLPPEWFKDNITDIRFDIWSLGIISLELLLGKRIYELVPGDRAPALRQDFPSVKMLKEIKEKQLRLIVQQMLKKDPKQRPIALVTVGVLRSLFEWQTMQAPEKGEYDEATKSLQIQIKQQNSLYKFNKDMKSGMIELSEQDKKALNFMDNAARSFVEVEGAVYKKGSSIRMKVDPNMYLAVGLGVRNYQLDVKGFKWPAQQYGLTGMLKLAFDCQKKFDYGLFLIFHIGQVVYPVDKQHKQQFTNFKYKAQDVMRIETNQKELIFIKEKGEKQWDNEQEYKIPIDLTDDEWKEACFIACLYGRNDSVTILPPLQPQPKKFEYGCEIW